MATTASAGNFVTEQKQGEYRASKFVGVDIYGSENQKIGDVNEILMDASGNAKAIVIGVGGFLGIGEKNVAVPFSAVEWMNERRPSDRPATTAATTSTGGTGAGTMGAGTMATGSGAATGTGATTSGGGGTTAATAPVSTTMTGSATMPNAATGASARSPAETAAYNGYPDHGMVKMSKADLQNAPTFRYYADANTGSGGATNANPPATTTPRQ